MTAEEVRQVEAVVVGAGPVGVTAATLLAQQGVDCLILDRWPGVYPQPRAVHLDDEIYRIVSRLGIADEFAAISRPALGLRLLDNRFRVLAEFHRDSAPGVHGFPQANMFDQPEFETLLRANLKHYPAAELRGNAEVTEIVDHGTHLRVTFTDGCTGRTDQVDTGYVLGCDGANSLVRKHIGATMRDLKFEQRWLVVDVATDADLRQWDGVHQVCDPVRAATYMRIGEARYRWEFRLHADESADDFATLTALRPLIAPWVTGGSDRELTVLRVAEYTFRAQIADHWRRGNIFLLGDAAHLTPPFIGQGMGAGLRDAMNLSWKIAAVRNSVLAPEVLDSYERERAPHTRQLIRLALNVGRAMTGGGRLGGLIRRLALPRVRMVPGLRDKVIDSTTPALRRSGLVHRSLHPRHLAGTLCPNSLMPDGRRLDDAAGTGFAFVTSSPLTAAEKAVLRRYAVALLVVEPGSELGKWLHRGRASAAVVRPDHTVMRAGRDADSLCRWIGGFMRPAVATAR